MLAVRTITCGDKQYQAGKGGISKIFIRYDGAAVIHKCNGTNIIIENAVTLKKDA